MKSRYKTTLIALLLIITSAFVAELRTHEFSSAVSIISRRKPARLLTSTSTND